MIACSVSPTERDAWSDARRRLRDALVHAEQRDWPIELKFVDSPRALASERPDIAVISLLPELEHHALPFDEIAERLRGDVRALSDSGVNVFLCFIFRACDDPELLERIRRLNLFGAEISHETGAGVIDFDRAFAHIGAQTLQTNYLFGGPQAARYAGRIIVDALLSAGLDDAVPVDVLQRAQSYNWDAHDAA